MEIYDFMKKNYTVEEIQELKDRIDKLSQLEMAQLWRFAPSGHAYFRNSIPELFKHFSKRFQELGGMTPNISKTIGWE